MYKTALLILFFNFFLNSFAQKGKPFIENFPPSEYLGEDQIWTISQNKNGVMFFGVGDGLLKYDGVSWNKFIITENKTPVLSSIFGDDGFLYVGSVGEFGYFNTNNSGNIKYNSLKNLLDTTEQLFTNVWSIAKSKDNIYFATDNGVFRFNKNLVPKIKKIGANFKPFLIYNPKNEVFISFRDNNGLYKINGDTLIKVKTNQNLQPWFMLPFEKNTYLVGNKNNSLQLLYFNEKDTIAKLINSSFNKTEISKTNNFFKENQLYTGACVLNKNEFAMGTIRHGIVIVNKQGKIIEIIGKKQDLLSSTVHTLFLDKQDILWSGVSFGISKIEYNSPFRFFNEKDGIPGTIYNLTKFKNKIYASSNLGLYYYENNHFVGMDALTGKNAVQIFMPLVFETNNKKNIFLVSTIKGIYSIQNKQVKKINSLSPNSLFQSEFDKSVFYCGLNYKLISFSFDGNNSSASKTIYRFDKVINSGIEKDKNNLWLILEGKPYIFNIKNNTIINFNKNKEIKNVSFNGISKENKTPVFLTSRGFYKFNSKTNKFYKDKLLIPKNLNSSNVLQFNYVSNKLSWILLENNLNGKIIKRGVKESNIIFDSIPFKRLLNTHKISEDGDSLLWVTTSKEIYKYNVNNAKNFSPKSLPIISKIIIGKDSVIFNGNCLTKNNNFFKTGKTFDYSLNNIIFEFALPEYSNEKLNEFKFFLKGQSEQRESGWTKETYKEFSNLYEGTYTFKLKARNVYQKETEYINFEFKILPPWYRTWWAYLLYLILLVLLIYIAIKLNIRRLEKENIRLDNIVKKRTAEIYLQKEEIQTQADNLEEINNQLKNTNEEITLIAENLSEANKKIQDKNVQIIDSINYAKKIQKAILPSNKEISKVLDEFFIIYKPKDIVGGDFYFVKKINKHVIVAAADCTGHGVPGGFLSMMGVSFLNEIIQKKNTQTPSETLNSLRQKFKQSLRQKNFFSNSIDGIDIALCDIDSTNGILQYSGANSPILIIRDNNIFELEPDLQPIGIFFKETDFTLKSFQLKEGDIIYMFSDGFQDQFGGKNNKKLLYKNFKKMLIRFSNLPLNEQRIQIIKTLHKWQGDYNQVDDILLLGFKITKNLILN